MNDETFLERTDIPKRLILIDVLMTLFYFGMLVFFFQRGALWLWSLLIIGEIFHVWQALTFLAAIWDTNYEPPFDPTFVTDVDVFIPVAGEPVDVVERTIHHALNMEYRGAVNIFILNDGYVARKENWQDIEALAERMGVNCITRLKPGGAKAGNINNALGFTQSPFIVFFDADHAPERDFLVKTAGYFADPGLAFVQTPQFYENQDSNFIARGAWEQQTLFFGPICKGKNRMNAVTMCGTNMVVRRAALEEVGGMCEASIAEDFVTGFMMHKNGWRSVYVPEILARGLAPEDFRSYYKQQERWARGSLDLLFRYNLIFTRGLTLRQRIQYLSSVSYFLSGWVVLIDALIPIIFFYTGIFPIQNSTMALAMIFLPYISLMVYTIQRASNFSFSYRALAFSVSGFAIHIKATLLSLFRYRSKFSVTAKKAQNGNFLRYVVPQIIYITVASAGALYSIIRNDGVISAAWVANVAWGTVNSLIFLEYVKAALPQSQKVEIFAARPALATAFPEHRDHGGS